MSSIKVTIPPLTFVKMFLRGVFDLSFIKEIETNAKQIDTGERMGIKTQSGIVTYFEKISNQEIIILTAYLVGQEDIPVGKRAEALMKILLSKLN